MHAPDAEFALKKGSLVNRSGTVDIPQRAKMARNSYCPREPGELVTVEQGNTWMKE
jgi:hypothetical protein